MSRPKPRHQALANTWWVNLFPDGGFNRTLYETEDWAKNFCTMTEGLFDAEQVQVKLVDVKPKKT